MIEVTQKQRDNLIEARDVMWPSVPKQNVYSGLERWRKGRDKTSPPDCGTVACFGGWCAWWPTFQEQGVRPHGEDGSPQFNGFNGVHSVHKVLFGGEWWSQNLFTMRGDHIADRGFAGNDHELVTHRINWFIDNSRVVPD